MSFSITTHQYKIHVANTLLKCVRLKNWHYNLNLFRNLRSTSNFLIAVESVSLIILSTTSYYNLLLNSIGSGLSSTFCFAAYFYVRFVSYFTPTLTFIIAIDRYIHIKFPVWYVLSFLLHWSQTIFFVKMKKTKKIKNLLQIQPIKNKP